MNEQEIFLSALEISDVNERAQFLDKACGNDSALRKQVESLLKVHGRQGEFLETPALQQLADQVASGQKAAPQAKSSSVRGNDQAECDLPFLEPSSVSGSLGRLQHFEIRKVLGRGAFGIVLKAFDKKLHRIVAIKVMMPELATTSPARKRFLREARSVAAMRHENIVSIYAVEDKPLPFLVMEFIDGQTLQQKLDQTGPLEILDILKIGRQIAYGLEAAHHKGLIHRDIKPANILLENGSERVILTDFGLARAADDASLSQSGLIAGTPLYMSPEQALGRKIDERSDLFSIGSVLYAMCTGRPPFRAPNAAAVIRRVAYEQPRSIQEVIPETPSWLVAIIAKLHAKNPGHRFHSSCHLRTCLEHSLNRLRQGQPGSFDLSTSEPDTVVAPEEDPKKTEQDSFEDTLWSRWLQNAAWRWLFLGGGVLIVASLLLITKTRSSPNSLKNAVVSAGNSPVEITKAPDRDSANPKPNSSVDTGDSSQSVPNRYVNKFGMEFVRVPKGFAWIGGERGVNGKQFVSFGDDFYLGATEVTQSQWKSIMKENPSHFQRHSADPAGILMNVSDEEIDRFPVESMTWHEAQDFLKLLNLVADEADWIYRLPTDAEWEYACRGGPMKSPEESAFDYHFDKPSNDLQPHQAHTLLDQIHRPFPVGSLPPNSLGLYDMIGNVCELSQDLHYSQEDGSQGNYRLGGGFYLLPTSNRIVTRWTAGVDVRDRMAGLRVARVPAATAWSSEPDALAARYIISIGGGVKISGSDQMINDIANLPATRFKLHEIDLQGNQRLTTEGLKILERVDQVTVANLNFTNVTDEGVTTLRNCRNLERLLLTGVPVDGSFLIQLDRCQNIHAMYMADTQFTDEAMKNVAKLSKLRNIMLCRSKVTNSGLAKLSANQNLVQLTINRSAITNEGLPVLSTLKHLNYLDLTDDRIGDDGVQQFLHHPLRFLYLSGTDITDASLKELAKMTTLEDVNFSDTKVTVDGIDEFKRRLPKCKVRANAKKQ